MIFRIGLLSIVLLTCTSVFSMSLPELESRLDENLEVRIAELDYERDSGVVKQSLENQGWKLLGTLSLSDNDEIASQNSTREYQEFIGQVGIQYPLFGSQLREQEIIGGAKIKQLQSAAQVHLIRQIALQKMQSHYVAYWGAQQRLRLSNEFLSTEEMTREMLQNRSDAGLLLRADYRASMNGYAYARVMTADASAEQESRLQHMALLSGQTLELFQAAFPELLTPCTDPDRLEKIVKTNHPELLALSASVKEKRNNPKFNHAYAVKSNLRFSYSVSRELNSHEVGHAALVAVNFEVPIGLSGVKAAARDQASAELDKTRLRLALRTKELQIKAKRALSQYSSQREKLSYVRDVLASRKDHYHTQSLRIKALSGDVLEQFLLAREALYKASLDEVEAVTSLLNALIRLNAFASLGCNQNDDVSLSYFFLDEDVLPERQASVLLKPNDKVEIPLGLY